MNPRDQEASDALSQLNEVCAPRPYKPLSDDAAEAVREAERAAVGRFRALAREIVSDAVLDAATAVSRMVWFDAGSLREQLRMQIAAAFIAESRTSRAPTGGQEP